MHEVIWKPYCFFGFVFFPFGVPKAMSSDSKCTALFAGFFCFVCKLQFFFALIGKNHHSVERHERIISDFVSYLHSNA